MAFYRLLLRLYPKSFRDEYGREMLAIFALRWRGAGVVGRLALLIGAAVEVGVNALAVHIDLARQDLRHFLRTLRRTPGFAITAVLIMALGVGATTAVFSVADYVMLRPLPFPASHELVRIWETRPGYGQMELSPATYRDWRARQTSLAALGAYTSMEANFADGGDPVRLDGAAVTASTFAALQVAPVVGRVFVADDEIPNGPRRVMLGDELWQSRFGGAASVIGRQVRLDGELFEIVGVMPPSFRFPDRRVRYWVPLALPESAYTDRNDNFLLAIGRLEPGIDEARARAEFQRIAADLEREHPAENKQAGANLYLLRQGYSASARTIIAVLGGAAFCLLLIACVNLANLLLARGLHRRRELVVRSALGAGRDRLRRQLATETLTLSALGGGLGVFIASTTVPLLARLTPMALPMDGVPAVDARVMAFAIAITMVTGLSIGLAPLVGMRRASFVELRDGGRGGGGARESLRGALVVAGIVCAVVLLTGTGLLLRALWRIQDVSPGFDPRGVLTLQTALPMPSYVETARRVRWYRDVVDGVKAIPGVTDAAYISFLPMTMRGGIWPVVMAGDEVARSQGQVASLRYVTPGFFDTLRIPIVQGRDLTDRDTADRPYVAVVSRSLAERYWPGEPAIGRRFTFAFADREIVGIVNDIRVRGLESESEPQVYVPAAQVPDGVLAFYAPKDLAIRVGTGDPASVLPAVREVVRQLDPDQPISDVRLLSDVVADDTGARAVQLRVISLFAIVALLLAGIGLHGLQAFAVSQRQREIGVRMTLGATRAEILRMVLGRAARLAVAGIVPGVLLALAAGRALESLLAGVPAADPTTLTVVVSAVALTTVAGTAAPAIRATRVDPAIAVRAE
ncbi:MAG TPA: ABC transporter permease [Vicinamibacterales bacterium]|nr:ABC transporter permease [Vicinamibacterales bacterium]